MSGAHLMIRLQDRAMAKLRHAGATSADRAVSLESVGIRRSLGVRRLISARVLVPAGEGYFLDEAVAEQYLVRRKRRVAWLLTLGIAVAILILASNRP